jgi:hypothetical protein
MVVPFVKKQKANIELASVMRFVNELEKSFNLGFLPMFSLS